jgi:hypothetical protein
MNSNSRTQPESSQAHSIPAIRSRTLLKPDTRIGTSMPGADPAGDFTWHIFHRVEAERPVAFKTRPAEKAAAVDRRSGGQASRQGTATHCLSRSTSVRLIYSSFIARAPARSSRRRRNTNRSNFRRNSGRSGIWIDGRGAVTRGRLRDVSAVTEGRQATLMAYGFIPVVQGDDANPVRDARHERTR